MKAPTQTETGIKERACSFCGYTESAEIPVIQTGTTTEQMVIRDSHQAASQHNNPFAGNRNPLMFQKAYNRFRGTRGKTGFISTK